MVLSLFTLIFPINDSLTKKVEAIIKTFPAGTQYGIMVFDPQLNDTLVAINIDKTLIPASNTKLFSSSAALFIAGADFELSNTFVTDDLNIDDSVINGNLFIVGKCNPLFDSEDLTEMINELMNLNIKRITGNVLGDDSFFDKDYYRHNWIEGETAYITVSPVSALILNDNYVTTKVGRREQTILMKSPPIEISKIILDSLIARGIKVDGSYGEGVAPAKVKTLATSQIRLTDLLKPVNKSSDNFYAECVFRLLGAVAFGSQGTALKSYQALYTYLRDIQLNREGLEIVDGSGISRSNRTSAANITHLLEKMYNDYYYYNDFYSSLAIGGVDGTLRKRMKGGAAEGNFRGKTGTLNGVSTLSGYLKTKKGNDLVVTILINYTRGYHDFYREKQDRIVEIFTGY
ncbi:MAG: D-alanyl-D-alanine carboxypeptidase/D-alanyl-D-alanine-endopeptidase [Ignavibacteriaceae bacterium]|nr:D-alanyl-D-alanine carboxypeptidase/D-alanyl-D-alanine-endopeptidase [Ignavibacteriaceae bacterium]